MVFQSNGCGGLITCDSHVVNDKLIWNAAIGTVVGGLFLYGAWTLGNFLVTKVEIQIRVKEVNQKK